MNCIRCSELVDDDARFCASCGAPVVRPDPLLGSIVAGRFRVVRLIAEGGMGRVYEATQDLGAVQRKVALKVLLPEFSLREADRQRFLQECATVAELEHPNTIKFYDAGQSESGDMFIAMELLTGSPLSAIVEQGPMDPARVARIVSQLCGSLEEAHGRGILHRDLKPENVFVSEQPGAPDFVKLIDFGIAKRLGARDAKLTPLGVVLGSPPYMAPEQFSLEPLDARSDLYSLGVVVYLMLTGRLPFEAETAFAWATAHLSQRPLPIVEARVPRPMRDAVMRCLEKDRAARPATVRAFWQQFSGEEVQAVSTGSESAMSFAATVPVSHAKAAIDDAMKERAASGARAAKGTLILSTPKPPQPSTPMGIPSGVPSHDEPAPTIRDPGPWMHLHEEDDPIATNPRPLALPRSSHAGWAIGGGAAVVVIVGMLLLARALGWLG